MHPSPEQQNIIDCTTNRVVIAKPGSGKTFTLSCIIKKELSVLPSYKGVIAISYTNKASNELRNRCLGTGLEKKASFFGTIDKFCISQIIFPYLPHICGSVVDSPVISDIKDQEVILEIGEETIAKITECLEKEVEISTATLAIIKDCYKRGHIILQLVPRLALYLLLHYTPVTKYLTARYSHIVIDEYQDTGEEQHNIFFHLSKKITGIAVGDIDQSIFGFAGKDPKYLRALTSDKDFQTFSLNRNHRCHPSIINYSLKLITPNVELLEADETRVFYRKINADERGWGSWISNNLQKAKTKYLIEHNNQCAILVRNRRSGALICETLTVPYKYFLDTPLDNDSSGWAEIFKEVLNTIMNPKGNVVDWIIAHYSSFDKEHKKLYENLEKLRNIAFKQERLMPHLELFFDIARFIRPEAETETSKSLLKEVISNPQMLANYTPANEGEIQILTLHKSKGLEFEIVFHVDLNQWIIPCYDAIKGNQEAWQQDINLHYVGITRAKKCCVLLSSVQRHYSDGTIRDAHPSTFLTLPHIAGLRNNPTTSS